jgi:hypothetical protein
LAPGRPRHASSTKTATIALNNPPFTHAITADFSTKMPPFSPSEDLELIQRGQALRLPLKTAAFGECILSIKIDTNAKQALAAAEYDWLGKRPR